MTTSSSSPSSSSSPPSSNSTGFSAVLRSRRRFLQALAAGGLATGGGLAANRLLGGDWGPGSVGGGSSPVDPTDWSASGAPGPGQPGQSPTGRRVPGAVDGRVLVVVDLVGGNDGLSTLVPAGDAGYHDRRPTLAIPDDEVLALDAEVGLHRSLARLHRRGITTVEGVGPVDGDLSHFAMTERWERGDVRGEAGLRTGFLGRLCDAVDHGGPLVGVSLQGPTPHLVCQQAATMSLSGRNDLWFLEPTDWVDALAFQRGLATFAGGDDELAGLVVDAYQELTNLANGLASGPGADDGDGDEINWDLPMFAEGGQLGHDLYFAADLIESGVGVQVVYVAHGDYDTHQGHQWRHPELLSEVDAAVDGFLDRAEVGGWGDSVLVATVSEFGRRVQENESGLDHGSASTMLVAGPVDDRRLGERPPLNDLDDDGNLKVGVGFDRYLASLAQEWLGVEAASILPGQPEPLGLF